MKISKLIILSTIILSGVLCGCQSTPDKVKENMDEYGDNSQVTSSNLTYCTVEELRNTTEIRLPENNYNFKLPEKLDFSGVESVSNLKLSLLEDFYDKREKYIELFDVDKDNIQYSVDEDGRMASYESDDMSFYLCDDGFMSCFAGLSQGFCNDYIISSKDVKLYDLERDKPDETITFNGEKIETARFLEDALDWLNDNVPPGKFEYEITDLLKRELSFSDGQKKEMLSLTAETLYKGVHLCNHIHEKIGVATCMNYDSPDKVSFYSSGNGRFQLDSAEEIDRIISPESAMAVLCEEIADFQKIDISEIIPVYIVELIDGQNTDHMPGLKYTAKPFYLFLVDEKYEVGDSISISRQNSYRYYYLVDMVTGEFTTNMKN